MPRSLPRFAASSLALAEAGVVGGLLRHVEGAVVVADVVVQRDRRLVGKGVLGDEVAPADLRRVDLHLARRRLDEALDHVGRLRPAGAAIGVDRHGVGEDRRHLAVDRRRRVRAGEQRRVEVCRDRRREGREVGAHIGDGLHPQRQELAVLVDRQLGMGHVVAAVRVGDEALRAVRRPLDRACRPWRRPGDDGFLGVVVDLGAEAAAHVGRHHPQLVLGQMQHEGAHQQPDHVRVLAGGVERVFAGAAIVLADRRARLHGVGDQAVVDDLELRHMRRLREGGVDRHPCRRYASRSRCCSWPHPRSAAWLT